MYAYNAQMYERIQNRTDTERSELERFYLHLIHNIVSDICDSEDIENDPNNYVFCPEFPSRLLNTSPFNFLAEELPVDIEDRQFYLYVRDANNGDIGYRRYFISSYNSDQYAERVREEYLRNQIAYYSSEYICRYITNPDTRTALLNDTAVMEAIRGAEGHEFLFSLVDADEMTGDIIDEGEISLHELIGIHDDDYASYAIFKWRGSNDPIKYFASIVE
jgi:hypothetical protein